VGKKPTQIAKTSKKTFQSLMMKVKAKEGLAKSKLDPRFVLIISTISRLF